MFITYYKNLYLDYIISTAERKKNVSCRADEERRISPYTGRVLAVKATRQVVLHPRAEIRRSSSRRDTFFFRSPVDMFWSHNQILSIIIVKSCPVNVTQHYHYLIILALIIIDTKHSLKKKKFVYDKVQFYL